METDFFKNLKTKIETATKNIFKENIKKYGDGDGDGDGDGVCAFALMSDDGAMTVVPFTNTSAHLNKMQRENPDDKAYYEFEPGEWFTSDGANTEFNDICKILSAELNREDLNFMWFKQTLFESCVQVLEKLRAENFFTLESGKDLFVLFSVSDTLESEENLIQWAKRLNKPEQGKYFEGYMNDE